MSDNAIRVDRLSKRYTIGRHHVRRTAREALMSGLSAPVRLTRRALGSRRDRRDEDETTLWALKDVTFEVKHGEVVGVIGRNGAGKSTLLRILSRITEPTSGEAEIFGRVGSLLEVGTGFHPDLTGRENIFLNGAILGMRRAEVVRKFDEIVAFAEVERFIDTSVKYYSSGMYTRLAFAVAAHLETEILVVDEVLAVGDAEFQRKCLGRMGEVARQGRTILFVSHNMGSVQALCSRGILLSHGTVLLDGDASAAVKRYLSDTATTDQVSRPPNKNGDPTITGVSVHVQDSVDSPCVRLSVEITSARARPVSLDLRLFDGTANPVGFGSLGSWTEEDKLHLNAGKNRYEVEVDTSQLAVGSYILGLYLTVPLVLFFDQLEHAVRFDIARPPRAGRHLTLPQNWGCGSYELPVRRALAPPRTSRSSATAPTPHPTNT
jgi:lipopolysaccharide transport system ATP-binding protein